jgi:hypothetical protein
MILIHILHKYQLIHVGIRIGITQILIEVAIEHVILGLLCPVLLIQRLNFLILVIKWIFQLDFDVDRLVVVLCFGVGVLLIGKRHLATLAATAFGS